MIQVLDLSLNMLVNHVPYRILDSHVGDNCTEVGHYILDFFQNGRGMPDVAL